MITGILFPVTLLALACVICALAYRAFLHRRAQVWEETAKTATARLNDLFKEGKTEEASELYRKHFRDMTEIGAIKETLYSFAEAHPGSTGVGVRCVLRTDSGIYAEHLVWDVQRGMPELLEFSVEKDETVYRARGV